MGDGRGEAVGAGSYGRAFRRGFFATSPLWLGAAPFGVAFALLARAAGFTAFETQVCSALIYAGASQVALVTLVAGGAGAIPVILTTLLLNLRHLLYGLSLGPRLGTRTRPPRPVLAFLLTDEGYGLTIKEFLDGRGSAAFFLGSGVSLYAAFNLATLAGSLLGTLLPDPSRLGLDFIFPLTFLALLTPLLRSRRQVAVAAVSGLSALVLSRYAPGGVTVLVSAVGAATLGAALDGRTGAS
jgi:4-azaleucine resistance transporter AzlC